MATLWFLASSGESVHAQGYSDATVRAFAGLENGDGRTALRAPLLVYTMSSDDDGNLYVHDEFANQIRRIDRRTGIIETVVGRGPSGFSPDGTPGTDVNLSFDLDEITAGGAGHVYFADNDRIRRWDPASDRIATVAGNGESDLSVIDGQPAIEASIGDVDALLVDGTATLYLAARNADLRQSLIAVDLETGAIRTLVTDSGHLSELAIDSQDRLYACERVPGEDSRVLILEGDSLVPFLPEELEFEPIDCRLFTIALDHVYLYLEDGELAFVDLTDPEPQLDWFDCDCTHLRDLTSDADGRLLARLRPASRPSGVYRADFSSGSFSPFAFVADPDTACQTSLEQFDVFLPFEVAAFPDGRVLVAPIFFNLFAIDERAGTADQVSDDLVLSVDIDRQSNIYLLVFSGGYQWVRIDGASGATRSAEVDEDIESFRVSNDGSVVLALRQVEGPGGASMRNDQVCRVDADGNIDDCLSVGFAVSDLTVDEDGSAAYVSSSLDQVFRIDLASESVERVAGQDQPGITGEGGPAIQAALDGVHDLDFGLDGGLFIMTDTRILRIDPSTGILERVAGDPMATGSETGDPTDRVRASTATLRFSEINGLAANAQGDVYFVPAVFARGVAVVEKNGRSIPIAQQITDGDRFGQSISASGDRVAIGSPDDLDTESGSGSVSIYRREDCRLVLEERITLPSELPATGFGSAVALNGDRLLVGAIEQEESKGTSNPVQAALFRRLDEKWELLQQLRKPGASGPDDQFGRSVALGTDSAVIGAPGEDDGRGTAYVYSIEDGSTEVLAEIPPPDPSMSEFGSAVAIDGEDIAISATGSGSNASGRVALFEIKSGGLLPGDIVSAPEPTPGDGFGTAIALDGHTLAVGSPGVGERTGKAYLFVLDGSATARELRVSDLAPGAFYGQSISLDDEVILVGAPGVINPAGGTGALFGFARDDPVLTKGTTASFSQVFARFYQQGLGQSVSGSAGRAFAGAPLTANRRGDALAAQRIIKSGGVAGLWYDAERDGEGFNIIVSPAGTVVFFYGYDSARERLWLVSETYADSLRFGDTIRLRLFDATEGTFVNPAQSQAALKEWGNLRMTLHSSNEAAFELNGVEGSKVSNAIKLLGVNGRDGGLGGLWFDPSLEGEGYNVISSSVGTVVYYYGSTAGGQRLWLISDTLSGPFVAGQASTVELFELRDGTFEQPTAPTGNLRTWGELTLRFDACTQAVFELDGVDGSKRSEAVLLAGISGSFCGLGASRHDRNPAPPQ